MIYGMTLLQVRLIEMEVKRVKADLSKKDVLNPQEAIELFVLSRRKFYALLKSEAELEFLAMYGTRKLIIRTEFEKYLANHSELRRRETYGN